MRAIGQTKATMPSTMPGDGQLAAGLEAVADLAGADHAETDGDRARGSRRTPSSPAAASRTDATALPLRSKIQAPTRDTVPVWRGRVGVD